MGELVAGDDWYFAAFPGYGIMAVSPIKADVVNENWTTMKVENNSINLQSTQVQKLLGTRNRKISK